MPLNALTTYDAPKSTACEELMVCAVQRGFQPKNTVISASTHLVGGGSHCNLHLFRAVFILINMWRELRVETRVNLREVLVTLLNALLIHTKFPTTVSEILLPFCVSQSYTALTRCEAGKCGCFAVTTRTVTHEICRINDYFGGGGGNKKKKKFF